MLTAARPRPARGPRHPGAHRAPQGPAAGPPAGPRLRGLAVERAAPRAHHLAARPRGCGAQPGARRARGLRPAPADDAQLRERLDGLAADAAVFGVERYGAEITTVITHTIERWDGKEAARRSRAARRARPAVHPDQRHDRRRPGRRADPHHQRARALNPALGERGAVGLTGPMPTPEPFDVPSPPTPPSGWGSSSSWPTWSRAGRRRRPPLAEGQVLVNGEVEMRRGRQLRPGRRRGPRSAGRAGRRRVGGRRPALVTRRAAYAPAADGPGGWSVRQRTATRSHTKISVSPGSITPRAAVAVAQVRRDDERRRPPTFMPCTPVSTRR